MLRLLLQWLLATACLGFVVAALLTPAIPTAVALMAAGSELHHMADTGVPASVELLHWTDWRPADESIRPSDWAPQPERLQDAQIAAYRIGSANGFLTRFTFYQARYFLADGTEVVAPAAGPRPLISARSGVVALTMLFLLLTAAGLFVAACRLSKSSRQTQPDVVRQSGQTSS